jgi:predicted nucleotidyltransferase
MGVVYTWDEVYQGHIPDLGSFKSVQDHIRSKLLKSEAVEAAVLCGSVIRGDHNRRSDIDCIVMYASDHEQDAMSVMHQIGSAAKQLHVPVNFVPIDTDLSRSCMHQLGQSFAHHIADSVAVGGAIKGDLVGSLEPTLSVQEEVRSYVRAKTYNLEEGWASYSTFSDERKASFLKKMLESPVHIARKMLHFHGLMNGDSKKAVRNKYIEFASTDQQELFRRLLELDAWYSDQLEQQVKAADEEEYVRCLSHLSENIGLAIQFARSNALLLHEPHS